MTPALRPTALRLHGVGKAYRRADGLRETVLAGFDLSLAPGELVALVGASGVGKTTLLHMAAGLEAPDSGTVDRGTGPRIGMMFQEPRLLDWLTVRENVALAADAAGVPREEGDRLLAAVGLAGKAGAWPQTLSGGQRQRAALARAFVVRPDLLLLDEPFSALDELTARGLRLLLQDLRARSGAAGLLVTHNAAEAALLADRVLVLGGRPAGVVRSFAVDLPRPRSPEDLAVFDLGRAVIGSLV